MTSSLKEGGVGPCPDEEGASRKRKSPRGPSRLKQELAEDDGWEPPLWRQQMENISKMREKRDAPVDLMGAHKNAEQTTNVSPQVRRYQVLVSLMLSSQTKDQITSQAMTALKTHGLTIENVISTPEEEIAKLIHPVGFWRKKAGYIKRVSQILLDEYGGDIPATMDQLCALPGVGPKMSHLVMDIAWDSTSGVAVDTHVHRISHRLGWMRKPTENPEVTRVCIEKWLPKSEWRELNWLLVGFGQQLCLPNAPKCRGCLNEDICPSSKLKDGGPWGKKKRPVKRELLEPVKTEPSIIAN
jgi:endonuclease-3